MTEDRINTIINELNYWKKNKMLPAVYCDYLLAIYTNGDNTEQKNVRHTMKGQSIFQVGLLLMLIMLLPFALLVMYTAYFPSIIQLGIVILFTFYSFWQYKVLKAHQSFFYHLAFAILLLLLLLISIFISNTYISISWITQLIIIINFVCWYLIGRKVNLKYLTVASIFGILLIGIFFVL